MHIVLLMLFCFLQGWSTVH